MQVRSCYKQAYSRGSGKKADKCTGTEEDGFNGCYNKCEPGFVGQGRYCFKKCPEGFKQMSSFCLKPAGYLRQGGFQKSPDSQRCGVMFFEKCREGFHSSMTCARCLPDCPRGMDDLGSMCKRRYYNRGPARSPACNQEAGEELD